MNVALRICAVVFFFAIGAYAEESVREFSFKTVDGKTIEYQATYKSPIVVNIGAHW